ncbi:MAG: lipid-binding protein [Bacteroidetes bacterium]|nr:lipid-binding protein [Bacteroidota bacterium]
MRCVLTILLLGLCLFGYSQDDWKLKTDKEGISIYTRTPSDSKFKAIRVVCDLDATLSQMVAVILDVNTGAEWVYSTKSSVLVKQVSPSEVVYYSEVSIPWPASNRDFIARLKAVQDTHTRVVTIYGPTEPGFLPVKKDIVRVQKSEGKWVIYPLGKDRIRVDYTLKADPGGDLPAWLVNMFVTKGPYESFKKLKLQLKKPAYAHPNLAFITD